MNDGTEGDRDGEEVASVIIPIWKCLDRLIGENLVEFLLEALLDASNSVFLSWPESLNPISPQLSFNFSSSVLESLRTWPFSALMFETLQWDYLASSRVDLLCPATIPYASIDARLFGPVLANLAVIEAKKAAPKDCLEVRPDTVPRPDGMSTCRRSRIHVKKMIDD